MARRRLLLGIAAVVLGGGCTIGPGPSEERLAGPSAKPEDTHGPSATPETGDVAVAWNPGSPPPLETTPSPGVAVGMPPCGTDQLEARPAGLGGAGGSMAGGFLLRNAGAEPCVLLGRPAVAFVDGAGHRLPIKDDATDDRPVPIVLEADVALPAEGSEVPAGLGSVFLVWSNWCGPAPASSFGLLVTPPDGGVIPVPMEPTSLPRCDDPRAPSTVSVGPFEATTGPDPTDPPAIPAETLRLTLVVPDHAVAGSQGADADHRPLIRVRVLRATDRRRGSTTGPPRPG
jgi:hypothetical protein